MHVLSFERNIVFTPKFLFSWDAEGAFFQIFDGNYTKMKQPDTHIYINHVWLKKSIRQLSLVDFEAVDQQKWLDLYHRAIVKVTNHKPDICLRKSTRQLSFVDFEL